ncbi:hypothetical protein GNF82_12060 [Clostridium perfringens]
MSNFFKNLISKAEEIHDNIFIEVDTGTEIDVEDRIKDDIRQAVKTTIDDCSKKYYRNTHVDFGVSVK